MRKRYVLDFDGFWIEDNIDKIPAASGIYVVYGGIYDEETKDTSLETIIYVGGASEDAKAAVASSKLLGRVARCIASTAKSGRARRGVRRGKRRIRRLCACDGG